MSHLSSHSRLARRAFALALGALALPSFAGCVPDFDDDASRIDGPRILAVRSQPAEAEPGEAVTLSVLVASPTDDSAAESELRWELCNARKPLTELGPVAQICVEEFGTGGDSLEPLGGGPSAQATLADDVCRSFGPLRPPAKPNEPAGRPVDPDPTGGYYQPVLVGTEDEAVSVSLGSVRLACGQTGLSSENAVAYAKAYRPNENPALSNVAFETDGDNGQLATRDSGKSTKIARGASLELAAEWAACPQEPECGDGLCTTGEDKVLCAEDCGEGAIGCSGAESYAWLDPASRSVKTRRESIAVAWYATAGRFESAQTGRSESETDETNTPNVWHAPSTPGPVTLWTVIRDARGGVGWQTYSIEVE